MKSTHKVDREIPFSLDMIEWLYGNYLEGDAANYSRIELVTATVVGFFFLLRVREPGNLRMSDVKLGRSENRNGFITIHIRNSKTDQFNEGILKPSDLRQGGYVQ